MASMQSPTGFPVQVLGKQATGAFQRLPIVPSAEEHIRSALKRANRVTGNKAIKNRAQHARNLSARKLDAFTKELASPLSRVVKNFPSCGQIHPFERALLDLTLGVDSYERRLVKLDALRKSCLEVSPLCWCQHPSFHVCKRGLKYSLQWA